MIQSQKIITNSQSSIFKYKAEKLYRKDNIYDVILVLDFNSKPIKFGKR